MGRAEIISLFYSEDHTVSKMAETRINPARLSNYMYHSETNFDTFIIERKPYVKDVIYEDSFIYADVKIYYGTCWVAGSTLE